MPTILFATAVVLGITMPLAWKWQLGLLRSTVFVVSCMAGFGAGIVAAGTALGLGRPAQVVLSGAMTLLACVAVLLFRFYRDPDRVAPELEGAILSPADGEVIYVRRSHKSVLPVCTKQGRHYTLHELTRTLLQHDAIVVGIAMNYLDVHVNRAPITGTIALRRAFPGRFGSLRNPGMAFENERATTVISSPDLQVAVVQIASRLVRQIVGFVSEGQAVLAGERIGVIRFGSQVDLVLPLRPDLAVFAKVGDRVVAGESIIAVCGAASSGGPTNHTGCVISKPSSVAT